MTEVKQVPVEKNRGGEWVTIGDEAYRIPPLAFRAVQELAPEIEVLREVVGTPTGDQMGAVEKIVHAAISRNYPSLKLNDVSDMLDLGNYAQVLGAVLLIGGFKKAPDDASGEAGAASTGAASTSP